MTSLHYARPEARDGLARVIRPDNSPARLLSLHTLRLGPDTPEVVLDTGEREWAVDILGGRASFVVRAGPSETAFDSVGGRERPLDGPPVMVYLPRDARVTIDAGGRPFEALAFSAPAARRHRAAVVPPDVAAVRTVGLGNWQRRVTTSIGPNVEAERLLVGETVNPPGNWSSVPPHKHDRDADDERAMEEIYCYRLDPPQGFALQRVYTAPDDAEPFDVCYTVRDGDAVVLPRGYHPVVAAPGYRLLYVWALAGDERVYGAWSDDPAHAWIKEGK